MEIERIAARNKRSEIGRQRSGVKLISDLRLLTSVIDGFNSFTFTTAYWVYNEKAVTPFECHRFRTVSVKTNQSWFLGLLFKIVFSSTANWAGPIIGQIFKRSSCGDPPFIIANSWIIYVATNLADPLVHNLLLSIKS